MYFPCFSTNALASFSKYLTLSYLLYLSICWQFKECSSVGIKKNYVLYSKITIRKNRSKALDEGRIRNTVRNNRHTEKDCCLLQCTTQLKRPQRHRKDGVQARIRSSPGQQSQGKRKLLFTDLFLQIADANSEKLIQEVQQWKPGRGVIVSFWASLQFLLQFCFAFSCLLVILK